MSEPILVLSRSAAAASLIARTLRWREFSSAILPLSATMEEIRSLGVRGVIVAESDTEQDPFEALDPALLSSGLPLLALGNAAACLCALHGGGYAAQRETSGSSALTLTEDPLFVEFGSGERVLHRFYPLTLSENLLPIAEADGAVVGFRCRETAHYGLQYPIERHDPDGAQLLRNFACEICGCRPDWNADTIIDRALDEIRSAFPGETKALCAVSGGVDSAVCAKLASLALGNRLECILVDTGLFHNREPQRIAREFEETGLKVELMDCRDAFQSALKGVKDIEEKERIASSLMTRLIAGRLRERPELGGMLIGTNLNDVLYGYASSDREESDAFPVRVTEPLRSLFKDEIRRLSQALSMPESFVKRQSFPTSGLASRIFDEVTPERLNLLRAADACLCEEIVEGGFDRKLWQYYAVLCQSPDRPGYYTVVIRALQAGQTTATSARLPLDLLERISRRVLQELPKVSRVVYDLTPSRHYREME